jgi:hypothetical protein
VLEQAGSTASVVLKSNTSKRVSEDVKIGNGLRIVKESRLRAIRYLTHSTRYFEIASPAAPGVEPLSFVSRSSGRFERAGTAERLLSEILHQLFGCAREGAGRQVLVELMLSRLGLGEAHARQARSAPGTKSSALPELSMILRCPTHGTVPEIWRRQGRGANLFFSTRVWTRDIEF